MGLEFRRLLFRSSISNGSMRSIEQMSEYLKQQPQKLGSSTQEQRGVSFQDVYQEASVKFSKHANERLITRNISLDSTQMERLENGMNKAKEKGLKEPLVMVDNIAFIVNTKSNTVVTAVNDSKDSVFTNIDGAVIS